ncbi:hypothetical protein [Moorena sp. SIO4G3]|uniref:hypothetical protein n=1 Tax=Moorena sp. SIO4G3 TaxID=2607821 RepID=UPI00142BA489|nr:hypothetical protein [Moorena sp. SIO4G3]NEO74754.1 hypothetical protein [Moorena sp. SIO4G3]
MGSEPDRFIKLAIELLSTAHQRINTEEKQETNQIKEILTSQLFPPPCTSA